jgi:hypothetical protein
MNAPDHVAATRRIEPALRALAKDDTLKVHVVAAKHRLEKSWIWDWLKAHNGGRREFSAALIDRVLAATPADLTRGAKPPGWQGSPANKKIGERINAALRKPGVKLATPPPAPVVKPPALTSDVAGWLAKQAAEITARQHTYAVRVTPALARSWLLLNQGNRKPSRAKILRFAAAMRAGKWQLNGETIKLSLSGRLLDGQSRLQAVIEAGVPAVLELRAGLPDAVQESMDVGELRKSAHMLEMMGEKYPTILSPALKLLARWEQSATFGGAKGNRGRGENKILENMDLAPLLARHAGLKASVGWCVSTGHKIVALLPSGEAAAMHYLLGCASAAKRDAFFSQLATGLGYAETSPTYHLRERLAADRLEKVRMTPPQRLGLIVKAWNAHFAGQKLGMLVFRTEGESREAFPAIAGLKRQEAA